MNTADSELEGTVFLDSRLRGNDELGQTSPRPAR